MTTLRLVVETPAGAAGKELFSIADPSGPDLEGLAERFLAYIAPFVEAGCQQLDAAREGGEGGVPATLFREEVEAGAPGQTYDAITALANGLAHLEVLHDKLVEGDAIESGPVADVLTKKLSDLRILAMKEADRASRFEVIDSGLKRLPKTWYPALLTRLVQSAWAAGVFRRESPAQQYVEAIERRILKELRAAGAEKGEAEKAPANGNP